MIESESYMEKKRIPQTSIVHYVGTVLNADKSVLKITLPYGFVFSRIESRLQTVISETALRWSHRYLRIGTSTDHWREAEIWIRRDYSVPGKKLYPNARERGERLALDLALRLFRLVAPGNLLLTEEYFITEHESDLSIGSANLSSQPAFIEMTTFSPSEREIADAMELLSSILDRAENVEPTRFEKNMARLLEAPFQNSACNISLQSHDLSFSVENPALAFLSLVTSLEVLFGSGAQRVARNGAVLLGSDRKRSEEIYKQLREIHEKRSKFVHSGKFGDISRDDVILARDFCRQSILAMLSTGLSKEKLLSSLNQLGFGDGSSLVDSLNGKSVS